MASLKSLLGSRNFTSDEINLEKGRIYSYMNGQMYSKMCNGFCQSTEMVQQLLILGAQVDQAQECVVAVEDYQEIQRHTQEKRLACQVTKEFVVV